MKRYIRSSNNTDTSQFQLGAEYKLYRKDGEDAVRTFKVINLSQKNKAIKVKGGINGIFNIKDSNDCQILLLGMNDRNYLSPSSKDIIRTMEGE